MRPDCFLFKNVWTVRVCDEQMITQQESGNGFHDNFPFDIFPLVHFLSRHFPTDTFPSDFFPTDSFPADIFPSDTFPDDFFSSRQFLILTFSQWILSHPTFSHCSNFVDLILRLFLRSYVMN